MARIPGPVGSGNLSEVPDSGTLALLRNPTPGSLGVQPVQYDPAFVSGLPLVSPAQLPAPTSRPAETWHFKLPNFDVFERPEAVFSAVTAAPQYVPQAILDATGEALSNVLKGIIPGLLMLVGVVALSTTLGAVAGAALGALAGGVGAVPGGAAGADLGFDAGVEILNWLGIGFLAVYAGKGLRQAVAVAGQAATIAWSAPEDPAQRSLAITQAAKLFASALALVIRAILQGLVAYLLAKGAAADSMVPETVAALRRSKLGGAFADWFEQNGTGLINNPLLKDAPPNEPFGSGGSVGSEAPSFVSPRSSLSRDEPASRASNGPSGVAELPPEARATIENINRGGPFPYAQDGVIFKNREGLLPQREPGYYHEYTVDTPGATNRGARRIVTGADGEMYYTDDHYNTFDSIEY